MAVAISFLLSYLLGLFYLGFRIFNNINYVLPISKKIFWTLYFILAFLYPLAQILAKYIPYKAASFLTTMSSYWIVFFFYGLIFFGLLDFFTLLDRRIDFIPGFLKYEGDNRFVMTLALFAIIFALGIFGNFNAKNLKVTEYQIETAYELKQNYTIALVSDIHIGYQSGHKKLKETIDLVNAQTPDYIFIAGDFIDGNWRAFHEEDIHSLLKEFKPRKGTYMVMGNHDNFLEHKDMLAHLMDANGIQVLRDEGLIINDNLYLFGRRDLMEKERENLEDLLSQRDQDLFTILLDHTPADIYEAESLGVNLQLSGHTHKGQMFPFGLLTERYFAFDYGQLTKDNYNLIVSSGASTWGPPVRIGTKSEVVRIEIKQKIEKRIGGI